MFQRIFERLSPSPPKSSENLPQNSGLENKTEGDIREETPQKGRLTPQTQNKYDPGLHEPSPAFLGGESQAPQNSAKILWVKVNQNPINNNNNNPEENTTERGDSEEPSDPRLRGWSPRDSGF